MAAPTASYPGTTHALVVCLLAAQMQPLLGHSQRGGKPLVLYHYSGDIADWTDVDRLATSLPEVSFRAGKDGIRQWRVKDKPVAWERPLRTADIEALGDSAPNGSILGVRTPDLVAKEALIASDPEIYFTTPHFDGYPAVLVQLEHIPLDQLEEVIVEAWLGRAPKGVSDAWLRQHAGDSPASE